MKRALELAILGRGSVSPNPMVGCVIVHEEKIIGEGNHQMYGQGHAEVNAVASIVDHSKLAGSTVYVTLEPCAHYGKTPPCADLLIEKNVKRVVVAMQDPNPLVSGAGLERMRAAGIEVNLGVCEEEAIEVNSRFIKAQTKPTPYIILKWAQTIDGFIARENYDSKWISDDYSRNIVHSWRAEEDAIMVGKNTAKYDNPKLTVRGVGGNNPLRIVLDSNLELEQSLNLFSDGFPTLCYNHLKSEVIGALEFVQIRKDQFLHDVLVDLKKRKVLSLIVEGGGQLLTAFISKNLWDEARVFVSPNSFGEGIKAPVLKMAHSEELLMADKLLTFRNK